MTAYGIATYNNRRRVTNRRHCPDCEIEWRGEAADCMFCGCPGLPGWLQMPEVVRDDART